MLNNKVMQKSFKDKQLKEIGVNAMLDLKRQIHNHVVSLRTLHDLKKDYIRHLNEPAGTPDNYYGKYGKSVIELAKQEYPEVFSEDEITNIINKKIVILMNRVFENAVNDQMIKIRSDMLKYLVNYLKSEREKNPTTFTFSVPFIESKRGEGTKPDPRE